MNKHIRRIIKVNIVSPHKIYLADVKNILVNNLKLSPKHEWRLRAGSGDSGGICH